MILFLVTILAGALWQPALIALVAWAALRLSRCSNATTRHALHVDGAYIRDLAAAGFSHLAAGQYVSLKALHVDAH